MALLLFVESPDSCWGRPWAAGVARGPSPDSLGRACDGRRESDDTSPTHVGIDVAKEHLDVAMLPSGEAWRVTNDPDGIDALASRLTELQSTLVVHAVVFVGQRFVGDLQQPRALPADCDGRAGALGRKRNDPQGYRNTGRRDQKPEDSFVSESGSGLSTHTRDGVIHDAWFPDERSHPTRFQSPRRTQFSEVSELRLFAQSSP